MSAANSDCWNVPFSTSVWGIAISRQGFTEETPSSIKELALRHLRLFGRRALHAAPAGHHLVVRARLLREAAPLTEGVEAVGELPHRLGLRQCRSEHLGCAALAVLRVGAD